MKQLRKNFTKEQNEAIRIEKDAELDSLIDENSKFIYSGKNRMLVDKDSKYDRWFKVRARRGYVEVTTSFRDNGKTVSMAVSRFIFGLKNPSLKVDHKNRNPLDNRLCNIRICDQSQNLGNRASYSSVNMYKGYHKTPRQITVESQKNGITTTYKLKTQDEEYAAIVYDCIAVINHGEFAHTNFNVKNYTKEYIASILDPIKEFRTSAKKYTLRTERTEVTELVSFEKLPELGFINEGDFMSIQIGNNCDLVINSDMMYSIRLNWKEGDGTFIWSNIRTVSELKTLIKLLTNQ